MDTSTFRHALEVEVATLQAKHPVLAEAIGRAHALLIDGKVFPSDDGLSADVESSTDATMAYHVNGVCTCNISTTHDASPCKHRLAYRLYQRVCERLATEEERWTVNLDEEAVVHGVDEKYVVIIQGKPFILYAGLLQMAHARGLLSLAATWTYNDTEVSLAHAVAVFADGRRFEESGDSTPANIGRKVAAHWRRISLTRAKSRCLRDALGIDLCSVEELGDAD